MRLTNRMGLPKTIVNAIERDDYSMGDARISVTGLLKPPRIGILWKKNAHQMEQDVTDHIWSLFGKAIHKILEIGGDEEHIPEERMFAEVRGWRISGQLDLQKLGGNAIAITDYKSTSAYAVTHGKREWEEQLNCYRWLAARTKNYDVKSLAVCAFIRDWSRHKAKQDSNYPQAPSIMVPIKMWTMEEADKFVEERVRVHQTAQSMAEMGDEPPYCTDEERWLRTSKYAVRRKSAKRATKVFDTAKEAEDCARDMGADFVVDVRKGEPIRCTGDYCGVSQWCKQYREWGKDNADR